jgi:hypothetical protein
LAIQRRPVSGKSLMSGSLGALQSHSLDRLSSSGSAGQRRKGADSAPPPLKGNGFWGGDDPSVMMEVREVQGRMDHISDELRRGIDAFRAEELRKQQEELDIVMKMKTLNTLFKKKITFKDSLQARAALTAGHLDHDTDVMLLDKHRYTEGLKDDDPLQFKAKQSTFQRTGSTLSDQDVAMLLKAEAAEKAIKEIYGENDYKFSKEHEEIVALKRAVSSRVSSARDLGSASSSRPASSGMHQSQSAQDQPLQPSTIETGTANSKEAEGNAEMVLKQSEEPVDDIKQKLVVGSSKIREKLRSLGTYINNRANTKILDNWNEIEAKFKQSKHFKTVILQNSNGLSYPVQHQALYASQLTAMLCSAKVLFHRLLTDRDAL